MWGLNSPTKVARMVMPLRVQNESEGRLILDQRQAELADVEVDRFFFVVDGHEGDERDGGEIRHGIYPHWRE
jgi:hypothetical protein